MEANEAQPIFPRDRVTVVGVLNVTPDSFSDGGRLLRCVEPESPDVAALRQAADALVRGGAHVLDVGGESTRPGADAVDPERELARVIPAIEALASGAVPISIDTRKSPVARAALAAGARVVNDVSGLAHDPDLASAAADAGATLIVGHMRGTPADMQRRPHYDDVLHEVASELEASLEVALRAGVAEERLVVDPGIGFGKRLEDNLRLLAHAGWFRERLGRPVLVGPSRKRFLAAITGEPVEARDQATHAACAVAVFAGADGVRVHDAAGATRAVAVGAALRAARRKDLS